MCRLLRVPRATFYRSSRPFINRRKKESKLTELIIKIFNSSHGNYGWRRIKVELFKELDIVASRRIIRRIMHDNFLISNYTDRCYKNYSKKDTVNREEVDNIVNREFDNRSLREVIVSDLTYIRVKSKWNYVCFITDLSNREIIGYSVGPNKTAELVYKAFMNIGSRLDEIQYFHSDRGSEFKNENIDSLLTTFGIKRSLSNPGCPYDNACAESLYSHSKTEFFNQNTFNSIEELELKLFEYVFWYNNKRLHSSLNYMSPVNYRKVCLI